MFCGNCGTENRNDRKFCSNCGARLHDYTKPKENLIMPNEIEQAQENVKKRNHVKLVGRILMAIFFVCAVGLTIVSAYVKSYAFWVVIGFVFACYFALLITFIVYTNKLKKLKNK